MGYRVVRQQAHASTVKKLASAKTHRDDELIHGTNSHIYPQIPGDGEHAPKWDGSSLLGKQKSAGLAPSLTLTMTPTGRNIR